MLGRTKNVKVKFERTRLVCLKIFTPDFNEWIKARRKTNYIHSWKVMKLSYVSPSFDPDWCNLIVSYYVEWIENKLKKNWKKIENKLATIDKL